MSLRVVIFGASLGRMTTVGTTDDLVSRIRHVMKEQSRPLAFIVGSGLTRESVTGVDGLIRAMRGALEDADDASRFDQAVVAATAGERYQQAAEFLTLNRGPELVNRVIRFAVLSACSSISSVEARAIVDDQELLYAQESSGTWTLGAGVSALGELLAQLPNDMRGPVLTTNFDPLVEIAVVRAGGTASSQSIDADGRIVPTERSGVVDVVHVHGLWRRGDTLHTVQQLTRPRPELDGSLRESLRGHVVVVMGYSGWPDALTAALRARALERTFLGIEVLWASFSNPADLDLNSGILADLSAANAASIYGAVDVNDALPRLLSHYRALNPGATAQTALKGWTVVDPGYLTVRCATEQPEKDRLDFFDGVEPTWRTAIDPDVPRLRLARDLRAAFDQAVVSGPRIVVAIGPMGEGKSLALRQLVASVVDERSDITVYWRDPGTRLMAGDVLGLPQASGQTHLLASDDGDVLVPELIELSRKLQSHGRTDIVIALAAQERDWRNAGAVHRLGPQSTLVYAAGLSSDDAAAIVRAWSRLGSAGLGELSSVPESERIDKLLQTSNDERAGTRDSLMGAMLDLRFGDLLRVRVDDLLGRLDHAGPIGSGSLTAAFLMISLAHGSAAGGRRSARGSGAPVSNRILARALGLDDVALDYVVFDPLGREAAISRHSNEVYVRHVAIAQAALTASRERNPDELPGVLRTLVSAAVALAPPVGSLAADLYEIAYLARRLELPDEAVIAAAAAAEAEPTRMSYRSSLVAAYKSNKQLDEAMQAASVAWDGRADMVDGKDGEAALLTAWGTAAGMAAQPALNLLLDAKALTLTRNSEANGADLIALNGVGAALEQMWRQTRKDVFATALAGVVALLGERQLTDQRHLRIMRSLRAGSLSTGATTPDDPWGAIRAAVEEVLDSHEGDTGGMRARLAIALAELS